LVALMYYHSIVTLAHRALRSFPTRRSSDLAQASYYEQAASANLGLPMASSVNVGQGYEHRRFTPPSLKDMYVTTNYIEEVDTPADRKRTRLNSSHAKTS